MPRQEQGVEYYLIQNGEKRFRVRWREGGRMKSRSFVRVSGEDGARAFYAKVREAQEATGSLARVSALRLTLAEFVADVWAPKAKRRLTEKTWKRDVVIYNKHILELLGDQPISGIDAETLVIWQEELEHSGRGAATIVKAMSILSRIFKEAARRPKATGVRGNPVALLEKPKTKPRRRPRVWGPVVVERVRYELLVNSLRINPQKEVMALRDAALVSLMEMTGCRPQDALALRWADIEERVVLTKRLSDDEIIERTKNQGDRSAPLLEPLKEDLEALRERSGDGPLDQIFRKPESGEHYVETDWRNYRSRHFVPALERVEASWGEWRRGLEDADGVRESVNDLHKTRPYDLGRHTHSALMLASGMSLQRLARSRATASGCSTRCIPSSSRSTKTPRKRSTRSRRSARRVRWFGEKRIPPTRGRNRVDASPAKFTRICLVLGIVRDVQKFCASERLPTLLKVFQSRPFGPSFVRLVSPHPHIG